MIKGKAAFGWPFLFKITINEKGGHSGFSCKFPLPNGAAFFAADL
jgi:hypothetical protein